MRDWGVCLLVKIFTGVNRAKNIKASGRVMKVAKANGSEKRRGE